MSDHFSEPILTKSGVVPLRVNLMAIIPSMNESLKNIVDQVDATSDRHEAVGWFEPLYRSAENNPATIPWAKMAANPHLVSWLNHNEIDGTGQRALVIGCGLGDDAEELARRRFSVVAFDISETAVRLCKERFPDSAVEYVVADMFTPPNDWLQAFDFVLEINIVQALPLSMRDGAIAAQTQFVARNGSLLLLCRARPDSETKPFGPPWALSRGDVATYEAHGLTVQMLEQFVDDVARFRVHFGRK